MPENQQTSCTRLVPDTVSPAINCTPKKAGTSEYDGCTPNTPCGPVHGCPLEVCDGVDGSITTTYAAGNGSYVPPTTLLPAAGTEMSGRATGWFARGDGTLDQGSCAFAPVRNLTGVALATVNFGNADWCGACAEVVGISGTRVRVQIVDQCAGCHNYSLDIPGGADTPLSLLDDPDFATAYKCTGYDGSLPITWKIVPCETEGGVRVSYLDGYNKWTPAIRLLNHRLAIAMLEEQFEGQWTTLSRETDNKYILHTRSNDTTVPVILRITAIDGATITGTFPTFEPSKLYEATSQF